MNNEKENIQEATPNVAKMNVKVLNIRNGLKSYDNVSMIKIKSKKYNLSIEDSEIKDGYDLLTD